MARCSRITTIRETAYALETVLQELIWIVGPLVVGIVVAAFSPSTAVVMLGAVGVLGTLAFLRGRLARTSRTPVERHEPHAGARKRGAAGSRPAAGLLLALWSVGIMLGGLWYGARAWGSSLSRPAAR